MFGIIMKTLTSRYRCKQNMNLVFGTKISTFFMKNRLQIPSQVEYESPVWNQYLYLYHEKKTRTLRYLREAENWRRDV